MSDNIPIVAIDGPDLIECALDNLRISDRNPRATAVSDAEIASLAESIALLGLQQNLIGYEPETEPGTLLITGGGLRLRALQRLAAEGRISRRALIPVMVHPSDQEAVEAAVAENEVRRPMAALDQFQAYRAMREAGHGPARIAAALGTDEAQVTRVLVLDRASNLVRAALRRGRITLDQARAFTVEPDTAAQNRLLAGWDKLPAFDREPGRIRQALREMGGARRAELRLEVIGRAAYAAAGGTLTEDLFSSIQVIDAPDLVGQLFARHIDQLQAAARAEGWAWTEYREDEATWITEPRLAPVYDALDDAEDAFLERVQDARNMGYAVSHDDEERANDLRARVSAPAHWTPDQMSVSGVVYGFTMQRGLIVEKGVLRPDDIERARELGLLHGAAAVEDGYRAPDDAEAAAEADRAHDRLSATIRHDLDSLRTVATANGLAARPDLALDVLAWLVTRPPTAASRVHGNQGHIHAAAGLGLPLGFEPVERAPWNSPAESLREFRARGEAHRNAVLARWVAQSLDATGSRRGEPFAEIEAAVGVSLREAWSPGAEFLARLTMEQLDSLYRELTGGSHGIGDRLTKPKKADAVDLVATIFAEAEAQEAVERLGWPGTPEGMAGRVNAWLPAPLREPSE